MSFMSIGQGLRTLSQAAIPVPLVSGEVFTIPNGQYLALPGPFTFVQWYDPVTASWRNLQTPNNNQAFPIPGDGFNYRLANLTGTVVGAVVTNGGSGYTNGIYFPSGFPISGNPNAVLQGGVASAPTVTIAAGGGTITALANLVVGGAINTTIAITTAGTGYTRAPILLIDPPPAGGVPATATCTISAGAINAVTVTNQGGGYSVAPKVKVVNAQGDTAGSGAVLTVNATLALTGQVVCIVPVNNGAGMTSVPAISFAPASTSAATSIMCFTITTGVAQTGVTQMGTGNVGIAIGALTAGTSTSTNPAITTGQFIPRPGYTAFNTTAGGGITFLDGGLHQIIPTGIVYASLSTGTISTAATAVAQTVGGVSDLSYLLPI